jgi:hypothetical protein
VPRRICGYKKEELTGGWRKIHNKELHNFYSSPNSVRTNKSRRMRWEKYVGHMEEYEV